MRGPQGVFVLPKSITTDLYFICTGTGVAPFRSMLLDIHQKKIPHQQMHLLFGCRKYTDSLYEQELKALESVEEHFFTTQAFLEKLKYEKVQTWVMCMLHIKNY